MLRMKCSAVLAATVLVGLSATTASAVDVTTCGQVVAAREVGTLTADLVCPPEQLWAVRLEKRATLDLAGHTLSGAFSGVFCTQRCSIQGPGTIADAGEGITVGPLGRRIDVDGVVLSGHRHTAVETDNPKARVNLVDVTISGNGFEPYPPRGAVNGLKIKVENIVVTDNFQYAFEGKVNGTGLLIDGNRNGIFAKRGIRLKNGVISNCTGHAIKSARAVRLENVTLVDNDAAGDGIDLYTARKPKLKGTATCSRSRMCERTPILDCIEQQETWGVCADD